MRVPTRMAAWAVGICLVAGSTPGWAQSGQTPDGARTRSATQRAPTRLLVTPQRQLYRQCEDWLAVEHRPSGDVITPQMRCRWAYR